MSFSDEQTYSKPIPPPAWDRRHRDWVATGDVPGLIAEIQAEINGLEKRRKANKSLGGCRTA